jgi:hypothetical protein
LPLPLSDYTNRLSGSLWELSKRHWPVLLSSFAKLGPIKDLSQVVFSSLLLMLTISRAGSVGNTKALELVVSVVIVVATA